MRCKYRELSAGFTLIEVILGSLLTVMVVTVAGVGLVNFSKNEMSNSADSELVNSVNRAGEFIADEIRQARRVVAEAAIDPTNIAGVPTGGTKILGIENANLANQIVYYTAPPRNTDRLTGPRVLYRYGPDLNVNGTYNTASWGTSAVADLIPNANDADLNDPTKNLKACDTTEWTRIPLAASSTDGFFVCTRVNGTSTDLTRVNIRINAKIGLTRVNNAANTDKTIYSTDTNVFARSAVVPSPSPSP
jgi:hypothetical protein